MLGVYGIHNKHDHEYEHDADIDVNHSYVD